MAARGRRRSPTWPREWSEPGPLVNAAQLELPGCERIDVGPILKELVVFWSQRAREATDEREREFYRRPMRHGGGLLVALGWRFK